MLKPNGSLIAVCITSQPSWYCDSDDTLASSWCLLLEWSDESTFQLMQNSTKKN